MKTSTGFRHLWTTAVQILSHFPCGVDFKSQKPSVGGGGESHSALGNRICVGQMWTERCKEPQLVLPVGHLLVTVVLVVWTIRESLLDWERLVHFYSWALWVSFSFWLFPSKTNFFILLIKFWNPRLSLEISFLHTSRQMFPLAGYLNNVIVTHFFRLLWWFCQKHVGPHGALSYLQEGKISLTFLTLFSVVESWKSELICDCSALLSLQERLHIFSISVTKTEHSAVSKVLVAQVFQQ